jgi:hypothetical protein
MRTTGILIVAAAGVAFLAGCAATEVGTERSLGAVNYSEAFDAARKVMGQYFTVASADVDNGRIEAAPQPLAARALGPGPGRQMATLRLRRGDGTVTAYALVTIQRQASASAKRLAWPAGVYDGPPNQTPAQLEAATTAEQNEAWMTERRDRELEQQLLADIDKALHGASGQ